jgi:aminomethyltransferase
MDEKTSPVEAALDWSIQKVRRPGGARAGGYPGASYIASELETGAPRRRVGLRPLGKTPVRGGAPLFESAEADKPIGMITSGGFAPSLSAPVAMGYVPIAMATLGETLFAEVRGTRLAVTVAETPFVRKTYKR